MAADDPHMLVALLLQMLVADHHVVDVGGVERQMIEAALAAANAEKRVMVDIEVAGVQAIKRAEDVALLPGIEFVRAGEAEHLAIPAERLVEVLRHDDEMPEPLDVRRALLDAKELALAAVFVVAGIDRRARHRDRIKQRHAVDDLDLVPVGIGQTHALAAARLVDVLDRRGPLDPRDFFEVFHARGMNGDPDIARLAQFGDMDVRRCVGAAHIEGVLGPIGAGHAELGQKLLLLVEIGRAQAPISEIEGFDRRHDYLPKRTYRVILEHFEAGPEQGSDRWNWVASMTARSSARSSGLFTGKRCQSLASRRSANNPAGSSWKRRNALLRRH